MNIRIPLPKVLDSPESKLHPYPVQVAMQTQELLQGTLFFIVIQDYAAGAYVRQPGATNNLKLIMKQDGWPDDLCEQGWDLIGRYKQLLESWVFQNTLISMQSAWDLYVRRTGEFIIFAKDALSLPKLAAKDEKALKRIGNNGILKQVELLSLASGETFNLDLSTKEALKEMSLVRNLGIHNRWEVDEYYVRNSQTQNNSNWQKGEVRTFDQAELITWHGSLIKAINKTSIPIAKRFVDAPEYTGNNRV